MNIKTVTVNKGINNLYYLGYYYPIEYGQDEVSKALLYFKIGITEYVEVWAKLVKENFNATYDLIIRNLRSSEIESFNDKQEDYICNLMLKDDESKYYFNLIKKTASANPLKKEKSYESRIKQLANKYTITDKIDLNQKKILIFDDVYTTGASMSAISGIIKKTNPDAIIDGLVLCKTTHNKEQHNNDHLNGNFPIHINYEEQYNTPEGYRNKGFFRRWTFFPQRWFVQYEQLSIGDFVRISLKESKESFLINYGNIILGFKHTPFLKELENQYAIDCGNTLIGCFNGKLYLVPIGYEKQYYNDVRRGDYEFLIKE